jgi:two-component system LytT family response regulator
LTGFKKPILMSKSDNAKDTINLKQLHQALTEVAQKNKKYKSTFLVQKDESLVPIETKAFAYFYINSNIIKGITFNKKNLIIDKKMGDLETELDPIHFFRVNRQFIIQRTAIKKINNASNGKLSITVFPESKEQIIISKIKSKHFKNWIVAY